MQRTFDPEAMLNPKGIAWIGLFAENIERLANF